MPNQLVDWYRSQNPGDSSSDEEITMLYGDRFGPEAISKYPDAFADYQKLSQQRRINFATPGQEFRQGVSRGVSGLEATGAGALALTSGLVGAEGAKEFYRDIYRRKAQEAAQVEPAVPAVGDVSGLHTGALYAAGKAGEFLPNVAEAAIFAGLGAVEGGAVGAPEAGIVTGAAGLVARNVARRTLARLIAKGASEEAIKDVEKFAAGQATRAGLSQAARAELMATAQEMGGTAASALNFGVQGAGGAYASALEQPGVTEEKARGAAAIAAVGSGIGALIPARFLHAVLPGVNPDTAKSLVNRLAINVPKEALAAGGAMAAMEIGNIVAERYSKGEDIVAPLSDAEVSRVVNAGVPGAALGAVTGGIASLRAPPEKPSPEPPPTQPKPPEGGPIVPPAGGPAVTPVTPVAPKPAGPNVDIVKSYQPWRVEDAKPDELLTARQAIATVAKENWNPALVAWFDSQPAEKQAWFNAELEKEKGTQNALPVRSPETVPVAQTPESGAGVVGQVRRPEEPAVSQAQGQNVPAPSTPVSDESRVLAASSETFGPPLGSEAAITDLRRVANQALQRLNQLRKPVVPSTPAEAERDLTALQEIRLKGLDTKAKIQEAFPHLSKEEAAQFRDAAFPERAAQFAEAERIAALKRQARATAGQTPKPTISPEAAYEKASNDFDESLKALRKAQIDFKNKELGDAGLLKSNNRFRSAQARLAKAKEALPTPPPPEPVIITPSGERVVGSVGQTHDQLEAQKGVTGSQRMFQEQVGPTAGQNETRAEAAARHTEIPAVEQPATPTTPAELHTQDVNRTLSQPPPETQIKQPATPEPTQTAAESPTQKTIESFVNSLSTGDVIRTKNESWFVVKRENGADLFAKSDGSHRFIDSNGTWASSDAEGFETQLSPEQFFSDALPEPNIQKSTKTLTEKEGEAMVGNWSNALESAMDAAASKRRVKRSILEPPRPGEPTQEELNKARDAIMGAQSQEAESLEETAPPPVEPTTGKAEPLTEERQRVQIRALIGSDEDGRQKGAALRALAEQQGISVKEIQEKVEAEIVRMSHEAAISEHMTPEEQFRWAQALYERQPTLSARTSTSVANQAYSTPAPLAFALKNALDVKRDKTLYEPTGGNGMLMIGSDLKRSQGNELNKVRANALRKLGVGVVTENDATKYTPSGTFEVVEANPPFGSINNVNYGGYGIKRLEHLIALRALEAMEEKGKGAIILGAKREPTEGGKGAQWVFENYLYGHYNVVANFEVAGDLYSKQGASWPVRVLVVDGKRVEPIGGELAPKSVERLNTWDDVWKESERIRNEIERRRQTLGTTGEPGLPVRPTGQPNPTEGLGNIPPTPSGPTEPVGGPSQRRGEILGERPPIEQPSPSELGPTPARPLSKPEDEPPVSPKPGVIGKPPGGVEKRPGGEAKAPSDVGAGGKGGSGGAKPGVVPRPPTVTGTEHQTPYKPGSQGNAFGTLTPKSVATGTFKALESLKERVGPIDDFVANRLNMSPDEVKEVMAAEQIDGVALAIDQIENGGAIIIGDETGIGKGRQGAALIRYAILNGKIPIFFTKDPKLFTDMYGDLVDIHTTVKPFIMGDPNKASIVDAEGTKIHRSPNSARQKAEMARIEELGLTQAGYDSIFATYSQVNTRNARQMFLERLAENNDAIIILDEAHEAAGDATTSMQAAFMSGGQVKRGSGPDQTTVIVPGLLRSSGTQKGRGGVLYMSATFAKRADNLPVFFRTSLSKASESFPQIVEAMKRGGVALQQAVSEALSHVGQYIRRERDFSGVTYGMKKVLVEDEAKLIDHVDQITDSLSEIVRFSQELRDKVKGSGAESTAMTESAIDMTDFAAIVHNQVGQLLLAAKADAVIEEAIAAHKAGEKPIIALMNTMESFLGSYVEDQGLKPGDTTKIRWNELVKHALERSLRTSEDMPDGSTIIGRADPEQFGMGEQYRQILEAADAIESNFPISPIDYIIQKLNKAGIRMVELTGRTSGIEYTNFESGEGIYRKFKKANKNSVVNRFNNGEAEGMVMNASGSTGLSAHASEKFKDQRPRHMIIAQPSLDINTFVQTLGRIKRTGMVKNGIDANGQPYGAKYTQTVLPLQAELRPAAMAARKMKSLNANTTAETDNAIKIEAEDLFNKYGDRVVAEYLDENPALQQSTGLYVDRNSDGSIEVKPDIARRFTGRMAIRPDQEQKTAYEHILPAYREAIEQMKQTGEYDLEVAVHDDWDAKLKSDAELSAGTDESNIFTAGVRVQKWEIKDNRHVPTGAEMEREFKAKLGGEEKLNESWSQTQDRVAKTLQDRMEAMREEMRAATNDAERNKISQRADTIREMEQRWRTTQDTIDSIVRGAGEVLELTNKETGDTFDGMLVDARIPKSGSMTPRNFRFRFAIDSPGGVLHLTAQDMVQGKWDVSRSEKAISDLAGRKTGARYDRYFIIGNPIRGYEATGGHGKVVRFKSSEGAVITGLMMPNNWGMEKLAKDPRVDLVSSGAAAYFLRENSGRGYYDAGIPIEAGNGLVRISKARYGRGDFTITVPSAKRTGGDIYLNERLRSITGDFTKVGNRMTVNVGVDNLAKAISEISTITKSRFRPVSTGRVEDLIPLVSESNRRSAPDGLRLGWSEVGGTENEPVGPHISLGEYSINDALNAVAKEGLPKTIADKILSHGVNATVKVISADEMERIEGNRSSQGYYDRTNNTIYVNADSPYHSHVVLHEAVHAATTSGLLLDKALRDEMGVLMNAAQAKLGRESYALQERSGRTGQRIRTRFESIAEFTAEALSNPGFQDQLRTITAPEGKGSLWTRFVDTIRRFLGIEKKDTNLLDRVLQTSDRVMRASAGQKADFVPSLTRYSLTKEVASYDADVHDQAVRNVDDRLAQSGQKASRGDLFRMYDEEYRRLKAGGPVPEITRPELQSVVQDVVQTLSKAGWNVQILKPQAAELVNDFDRTLRPLAGRTSGGMVDLNRKMVGVVMRDVTQPTLENMRVILEESGHIVFADLKETPGGAEILSKLFTGEEWSKRMTPEDIANIAEAYPNGAPPDIMHEEQFMAVISRKLAESGFNPVEARGRAQAVYRLAKDLYLKALMWVQKTFLGPEYENSGLAESFFTNRLESFLSRDEEVLSWINRLGGPKPTTEVEVTWHRPVRGGEAQDYSVTSKAIDQQPLVQDSIESVELNTQDNGLRYSIQAPDIPIPPGGFLDPSYKLNQQASVNNLRDFIHEAVAAAVQGMTAENFRKLFGITDTKLVARKLAEKASNLPGYKSDILPENWKSPDNRLKVARESLAALQNEMSKIQGRKAQAEARLPVFEAERNKILDAFGKDLKGEMLDSTKLLSEMRLNIRKLGADLVRKLYDTSRQMGAVEQQIAVLEGMKDKPIPASYGPVFQKLFTGEQLNGQRLFDLLSAMANDKNIDFSKPITEIRDVLKQSQFPTYQDMAKDTSEARALLGTVVAYAKTNERMMAKLQVRLMESGEERAKLAQELLDLRKTKPAELQKVISGLSKQAGIAANAKAAYREMLRQAANYAARIELANKRIALAEASRPEYQKQMDRFSSMLESHPDFHFADGSEYGVPESPDQSYDKFTRKTLQLNTSKSDVTDPKEIRSDMDKMSEWLYAREQAFKGGDERALNEDYHTVKRARDEIFRQLGSFRKFVLASQEWGWLVRMLPAGRQIASIGTPSARMFGVLWNRYQDQLNSTKQTVERMGYENVHEERKVLAVLGKGVKNGVSQQWYQSNILNPAIEFLEQRGDLLETSISEEQARDRAYQQLGNYLLGNKVVAPYIKDKMSEFMGALRRHITKLDESSNWWADRLEKAGMGVEDPKLGGKIRRFIKQGIVTVHRTFSKDFETMANALDRSGWAVFGSELRGVDPDTGMPWTIAEKYNQDPTSVHQTFTKYTNNSEHGDTIQRIFLYEIANSPKESLIRAPAQPDGITRIPADPHYVSEAWATAGGDIITFAENLHELYGGEGDKGAYVQSVLEDFNRVYKKAINIDSKVNPKPKDVKVISFKGLIPHAMIDAREIEDLPGSWFRYHTFDRTENTELARRVAAQIEWGRDGDRLASALQTVKEETAKDVKNFQAKLVQASTVVPSGKKSLIKQEAARLLGGMAEYKRLERVAKQAGLPEKVANDVYAFFHLRNDTEGNLRLGIRAAQELAFLMVNQPASAISQLATMFDTSFRLGASPLATKATLDTMTYTAKDLLNSITQAVGFQLFQNSYYEDVYNRLGFADAEIMRRFGDISATMEGEGGLTLTSRLTKAVRMAKDIQSFPVNLMGERAKNTVLRPLAPFSTTVLSANRALTVGNWKLAEKFVSMGVDAIKHDPTLTELTPEAIGLTGSNKDTFLRWQKDLNSRGLVFTEMVRGAKDRLENGNKTILTDDELLRTYSMAINEISLEASIATMPLAAYNNSFYKFASPLLGWTFRRGIQVLETPFNNKDQLALASFNRAMLGLATVGLGGLALSLVVDEYQEHLVGKKRNLRAIRAPLTLADFQGDLERINRIGTFGLVGELAGAAFNVGTGQGDNRSLTLDGRVIALQSFQTLKTAFNNLVNQNFDVDYLHVVRPTISAIGAGGLLQYTDIVNKGLGLDNIEARTLQRLNAENYLRVTARDLGMPVKTGGGFSATPTPMAPWVARMELAAYANDPEDFRNSWRGALQTAKDMKKDDPAGYVRRAYESRHPLRYVLGLTPSTTEYRQLLQNMDESGREAVTGAVRMFNHYGAAIGIAPFEGSERKEKQQRQNIGMIIPRLSPAQLRRNAYSTAMGIYP